MFDPRQFTALYHEYLEYGLTVRDFCASHHMRESNFYYWQNCFRTILNCKIQIVTQPSPKSCKVL